MKKRTLKTISASLATVMLLASCGGTTDEAEKASEVKYAPNGEVYPIECDDTLTIFTNSFKPESHIVEYWEEQTGINIEFSTAMTNSPEALSLMIASGDLPDIILTNLFDQPGGVQKYVDDDVIIDLTDYMEYAPNFKKACEENEEVRKMSVSDDGRFYFFPNIRTNEKLRSYQGLMLRKDLLDKYNLEVPETIDEWHTVLKTFKDNGIESPLVWDINYYEPQGGILTAFGVLPDFYIGKDGTVKYGYMEDGMKLGLKTLAQWYKEGLIYQDIVNASESQTSLITSGKSAAIMATSGGGMGGYLKAGKELNPEYDLVAAKLPVLKKGDKNMFSSSVFGVFYGTNGYITTKCKNVELAMRFLDYGYSEAGHMMFNFGKEGVSYEMKDGYPTYTDLIMNNPEGKTVGDAMSEHILGNSTGPFEQDVRYIEQYNALPQQQEALELWGSMLDVSHKMPKVTFTTEESAELADIMNNVNTCASENIFKFIMGLKDVDKDYDAFKKELKGFGIDRAIELYQTALDRYNKR